MKICKHVAVILVLLFFIAEPSFPAPGDLDLTFNSPGSAVVVQPDGLKIIVAGWGETEGALLLFRYNIDGTLDDTFGTGGVATYYSQSVSGSADFIGANAVAIQRDGKIVVVGGIYKAGSILYCIVLRYTRDGVLDKTFGADGAVIFEDNGEGAVDVAIQSDHKILVVTYGSISRYDSAGVLDISFGTGGFVIFKVGDSGRKVALQSDGKIVIAGSGGSGAYIVVLRYSSNGTPDVNFGTEGAATHSTGSPGPGFALSIQPDGKIIVSGGTMHQELITIYWTLLIEDALILRLNADGALDTTFGENGVYTFSVPEDALLPDLTGQWASLTQTCRNTKRGLKCRLSGRLNIQNVGTLNAPSSFVRFYLSTDGVYNGDGDPMKQVATGTIKVGKSKTKTFSYTLPLEETASGEYIIAVIDADNTVAESNESNNYVVFGPIP